MNVREHFNSEFFSELFSDCIKEGASLDRSDDTFTLKFPGEDGFTFAFSLLNDSDIHCFSDIKELNADVSAESFLENVDVLTATLLQMHDGVDRGIGI